MAKRKSPEQKAKETVIMGLKEIIKDIDCSHCNSTSTEIIIKMFCNNCGKDSEILLNVRKHD